MEINISINVKLQAPGLVSAILGLSKSLTQMKVEATHKLREEKVVEDEEIFKDVNKNVVFCSEDDKNHSVIEIEETQNTTVEEEKVGLTNKGEIESLSRVKATLKKRENNKLSEVNPHYYQEIFNEDKFLNIPIIEQIIGLNSYPYANDEWY